MLFGLMFWAAEGHHLRFEDNGVEEELSLQGQIIVTVICSSLVGAIATLAWFLVGRVLIALKKK
ncbi:MAG: hypothetical protein QM817_12020 [Archangium sp.]